MTTPDLNDDQLLLKPEGESCNLLFAQLEMGPKSLLYPYIVRASRHHPFMDNTSVSSW